MKQLFDFVFACSIAILFCITVNSLILLSRIGNLEEKIIQAIEDEFKESKIEFKLEKGLLENESDN